MSLPHCRHANKAAERIEQPTSESKQHGRKQNPCRGLGSRDMRQRVYELEFGRGMPVFRPRLIRVRVDDGYPVHHMGMGKQRNAAYIGDKQYRQQIFRYGTEQPVHVLIFTGVAKVGLFARLSKTTGKKHIAITISYICEPIPLRFDRFFIKSNSPTKVNRAFIMSSS